MTRLTPPNRPTPETIAAVFTALQPVFKDRLTDNHEIRNRHGHDESWHDVMAPDMVVFPETTEEVAQIAQICFRHDMPMIPFGVGTSLEGHVAAVFGGVSIDTSRMNQIIAVHQDDLDVTIQAGVTRMQLNTDLRDTGLFFPIDPGADATLGGMASTRASGTNAVRYGTMKENVLALTVVTPDGSIVRTGTRARKSSSGYDLTHLYVGAEGTLGIITELTLRLYGIPEVISAALCCFPTIDAAVQTVIETIQIGVPVSRIELLDETSVRAVNAYSKLNLTPGHTLFLEFVGTQTQVQEQAEMVRDIATEHGGADFEWTTTAEDRARIWKARHDFYYAGLALRPGAKGLSTDICVPISHLAEAINETLDDVATCPTPVLLVGHVGDGNFHLLFLLDPETPNAAEQIEPFHDRLIQRALRLSGTCTGEHGIGIGKIPYMQKEHGPEALDTMRTLKAALDPKGLMNPGKILP